MPLDGITARFLALELDARLREARVDRVAQPDRHQVVLSLRANRESLRLLLSCHPVLARAHLVPDTLRLPTDPTQFAALLRRHLTGARVLDIQAPGWERILRIRFQAQNELGDPVQRVLVLEMMGRHSNLVLLNGEERILDALLHVDDEMSRVREILPARPYQPPPDQGKRSPDEWLEALGSGEWPLVPASPSQSAEKALLGQVKGAGPLLCREILAEAGLDPDRPIPDTDDVRRRLAGSLARWLAAAAGPTTSPSLYMAPDDPARVADFHALAFRFSGLRKEARDVSEACRLFYEQREAAARRDALKNGLGKKLGSAFQKARRRREIHESDLSASEGFEQDRRFGDLLLALGNQVEAGTATASLPDLFDDTAPSVDIPLDPTLDPVGNARRYFHRYAKKKARKEAASAFLAEDLRTLAWLDTIQTALDNARDETDLGAVAEELAILGSESGRDAESESSGANRAGNRPVSGSNRDLLPGRPAGKKALRKAAAAARSKQSRSGSTTGRGRSAAEPPPLPPRSFRTSDGLVLLCGRNNLQNDRLTLRESDRDDLWFHVAKAPGPHVILRTEGRPVPDRSLEEAAGIAAWFSRGSEALRSGVGNDSLVSVDTCPVRNVWKPRGAKPGMVLYRHHRTLRVRPLNPEALDASPSSSPPPGVRHP